MTARFTADTHGQGPTEQCTVNAGVRLIFLHRSDDGLSTFFALEDEKPQWKAEGKHPLEYVVSTDIFDASMIEEST